MKRIGICLLLATTCCVFLAVAYISSTTGFGTGNPIRRTDETNIPFQIHSGFLAGALNADGLAMVAADSDPVAAIRGTLEQWNGVSASRINFADLQTTDLVNDPSDGQHVAVLIDTPENRAIVGQALGIALNSFSLSGQITDSDIIFNPNILIDGEQRPFSTTGAEGSPDLGATAIHEVGHLLGAGHTIFIGATMFQSGTTGKDIQGTLSSDDKAFAAAAYPAAGQAGAFGSIVGAVTFPGGAMVRAAFVVAIESTSFRHISAITASDTGAYRMDAVPPGQYLMYAEPLDGPVFPGNVSLPNSFADTNFAPTAMGGFSAPGTTQVAAGAEATVNFEVRPSPPPVDLISAAVGSTGGSGDAQSISMGVKGLPTGASTDLIFWGPGIDDATRESDIRLLAPGLQMRPGTVRIDPFLPTFNGFPALRLTADLAGGAPRSLGTVIISRGDDAAVFSGGLIILGGGPAPVLTTEGSLNAASFAQTAVTSESWRELFAENLGTRFVIDSSFPTSLDGVSLSVTDGAGVERPARIHFLTANRIQYLTPSDMAPGPGSIRVTNAAGGSASLAVTIGRVGPGFFAANANGQGPAAATWLKVAANGTRTDGFTFTLGEPRANDPIDLGSAGDQIFLSLFGTGFRDHQGSVACRIGGVPVPVFGAVKQGEFAGLDQAGLGPIPEALRGRRNADIECEFDGVSANVVTASFQ